MKTLKQEDISNLLSRGVDEVVGRENLEKRLLSGEKLRVKLGIDPTSPNIHLGRSIPLLKLQDFQKAGHTVVLIIGDFTGIIGDTSDKDSERPMLEQATVQKNLKTYISQAGKIIDISEAEIHFNSEWLSKLKYGDIGRQADVFSLNQFIARENIDKRLQSGKRISLRELLYPLMQGYDSVEIKADVEVGGTDQRFNLLAGRDLQREYGQEAQDVITNPLIEGLDGRKMSSSWGNTVNLFDSAEEMYGKLMSLRDESIIRYFVLVTRVSMAEINQYENLLKSGVNPRDIKMKLAYEIVRMYHSNEAAIASQDNFVKTFSKKEIPESIPDFSPKKYDICSVLVESGNVTSKSEVRRLLRQNAIKVNQDTVTDHEFVVKKGDIVKKGKLVFFRIA